MAAKTVSVHTIDGKVNGSVPLPAVFNAPIRHDVVRITHTNIRKNARQAYGVKITAGHEYSAESWGTGRAVARIPRVSGGGSGRTGQGAFGNMCRGGRMFAPNKTFRRWHRRVNKKQRRYAVASAIAASGQTALVLARGHKIDSVDEIPLVVDDAVESFKKTKEAVALLKAIGAYTDVQKVLASRERNGGKSKWRGRTWSLKRGPMVVFANSKGGQPGRRAFHNLSGVTSANVHYLNLLQLAPGGHLGRFVVWTKSAFQHLDKVFAAHSTKNLQGAHYIPRAILSTADIGKVLADQGVVKALRAAKVAPTKSAPSRNPLTNKAARRQLLPGLAGHLHNQSTAKRTAPKPYDATKKKSKTSTGKPAAKAAAKPSGKK